jgi:uncharacterized membrane protein
MLVIITGPQLQSVALPPSRNVATNAVPLLHAILLMHTPEVSLKIRTVLQSNYWSQKLYVRSTACKIYSFVDRRMDEMRLDQQMRRIFWGQDFSQGLSSMELFRLSASQ